MIGRTFFDEIRYIESKTTTFNEPTLKPACNKCIFFVNLARFWYVEDLMDIPLYNNIYLDFRSKLLGPIFSTEEVLAVLARNFPPLAKCANIGFVNCLFYAPVSQFAPNGISGEFTAYHDK